MQGIRFEEIQSTLASGFLYPTGRSFSQRPVLVINLQRAFEENFDDKAFIKACYFMGEYVSTYMGLPGKAEAVDIILDLKDLSLFSAPYDTFK